MTTSTVQITGLAELHRVLQELPAKIEFNVLRGAMRAGLSVIAAEAKQSAPVDDGDLKNSIRIRPNRGAKGRGFASMVLVAGGKAAWYAHLVEYGTASYYTGKGKTVGKPYTITPKGSGKNSGLWFGGQVRASVTHPGIKPQPFMRPAFDTQQGQALQAAAEYIRLRLPKEIAKAAKA